MNDTWEKLKDIEAENKIWIIYIGIIILSWYANYKEKEFLLKGDDKSRNDYHKLMVLIFSVLTVIYFYFVKDSYEKLKNISMFDSSKKKKLLLESFIGSLLIFISGIIFLNIAINDDQIEVEIAFN